MVDESSYIIITDSGGVQEEAPSLGKPVLVMRDTTECPEAVDAGTVLLVGTNSEKIVSEANKHPRVNILQPGCGVGVHCIAVDPYFIVADYPMESKIISTAREINNYKSFWCTEKVQTAKLQFELKHGRKPSIALMGLAFKPDIDDLRESPVKYIAQKVLQNANNEEFYIIEPNIESHEVFKLTDYQTAVDNADIIVFLVAHKGFKTLKLSKDKEVLDFCGVTHYR